MARPQAHWAKIGESGTLIGMKLMLLVFRVFGRPGFLLILYPVICYYYLVRKSARQASRQYLQRIRPYLQDDQKHSLSSFRHFLMFGEVLLDKLLVWMGQIRKQDVVIENSEVVAELDKGQSGGIIIVSHLGNFEIGSALAHQIPGLRLTILVFTHHAKKFNTLMQNVTSKSDIEILQVSELSPVTAMMFSDRINAGGYVVIAGDRMPVTGAGRVSRVDFLGGTAAFPQGAFILAGLLQCPVYLMFCLKQKTRYHIYFEQFTECLEFRQRKQRPERLYAAVQDYASRLEYYCLKAPMQWFNFFPFWTDQSAEKANNIAPLRE
jgi:predicted LPLAT superfamily acyltransferase